MCLFALKGTTSRYYRAASVSASEWNRCSPLLRAITVRSASLSFQTFGHDVERYAVLDDTRIYYRRRLRMHRSHMLEEVAEIIMKRISVGGLCNDCLGWKCYLGKSRCRHFENNVKI